MNSRSVQPVAILRTTIIASIDDRTLEPVGRVSERKNHNHPCAMVDVKCHEMS